MSFIVRSVRESDFNDVMALARQFTLLNLPADTKVLKDKIHRSRESFAGQREKASAEYLFVLEDTEVQRVIGTCLILAKHGTPQEPHYYFKIAEKRHQSQGLGVGFIHNVLRLGENVNGPTEIGGLLLDHSYRRRPEKLGRFLSMSRFIYMGLFPDRFEEEVLCELTPPLTDEGRSEFWEALGRRFTGMSYTEADKLSHLHKDFIKTLFPSEDIYLCLLDSQARIVVGDVADATRPAKHMLEKIGFKYRREVDPFDGGPHYGVRLEQITPIQKGERAKAEKGGKHLKDLALLGYQEGGEFMCVQSQIQLDKKSVFIRAHGDDYIKSFYDKDVFYSVIG